ncbi:MAG: Rrf2 family transcriptional regulator [Hydrotalea flava]|uniref:RrF2 family transcriptional regulator n=1 Tax=Hydrotalea TaxID=1004300 RepID=UPI0009453E6D|nr:MULTISPECIES: Rrf2 family transcriptional regulator [Hydrotalea]MBY0348580.1 Rrf2 family transcriptional regulator [Hydrotalea flava]RWZ87435.1 MAG: Rrf2 family transcriptional regulator [Hydrotalea sp. AMD]
MKITSQEEYGFRILLRIARCKDSESMSIQALSVAEGLTMAYVAKLTRLLRKAGYINSTPGNVGGYVLARPASEINVNKVLKSLGGALFSKEFCGTYSGSMRFCNNSVDCSVRSLWQMVQFSIDQLLDKVSLQDLIGTEKKSENLLSNLFQAHLQLLKEAEVATV